MSKMKSAEMVIEHWLRRATRTERSDEEKLRIGSKIERGKDRRRASFALGVIGIISIDPDSHYLASTTSPITHHLPRAGWVIGSFELTGEKTHGNSVGYGHGEWHPDREMRAWKESRKTYVTYIISKTLLFMYMSLIYLGRKYKIIYAQLYSLEIL